MNREAALELTAKLAAAWPEQQWDASTRQLWAAMLKDYDLEISRQALKYMAETMRYVRSFSDFKAAYLFMKQKKDNRFATERITNCRACDRGFVWLDNNTVKPCEFCNESVVEGGDE